VLAEEDGTHEVDLEQTRSAANHEVAAGTRDAKNGLSDRLEKSRVPGKLIILET